MDSTLPLTSKGIAEAKYMRQFRKDLGIKFDVAFVSDFMRTQQTADIVVNNKAARFDMKELRPNGTAEDAFAAMYAAFDIQDDTKVYVCTHNPLIQQMAAAGWLGFNSDANQFAHGSMLRIDTHKLPPDKHPLHWLIRPGLVEHMYESDLVESATQIVEHLGRASKARIVDPLIEKLRKAVARRFRAQSKVATNDAGKWDVLRRLADETQRFSDQFTRIASQGYYEGAGHVAGQLGVLHIETQEVMIPPHYLVERVPTLHSLTTRRQPPGYNRPAQALTDEIDATTQERIASIESDGFAKGLTVAAIATAIRQQFRDWANGAPGKTSRSETIATHEISRAFHTGGADVAEIVNYELRAAGGWIEKAWDGEPDACEEICMPNIEAGWLAEDEQFPSGDSEAPGHNGCRCSMSYRRAGAQSEESRR